MGARGEPTAVEQDYVKVVWSATEWGGAPATVSTLARRIGTSRPTVSATLKRLAESGLVRHERYGHVELTDAGTRLALAMVRRHRLIETFLHDHLGYAWDEVHDEAERLEHAVSETFVDRIDALLGHPTADPHGDPIPARDGAVDHHPHAVALDVAEPGEYTVLRVCDDDPATLREAVRAGLTPGTRVLLDDRRAGRLRSLADGTVMLVPVADDGARHGSS